MLDVTHKGVEETAARIMKIIYEDENANNYSVMKATWEQHDDADGDDDDDDEEEEEEEEVEEEEEEEEE